MPRDALRLSQQNSKKKIHEYLESLRSRLDKHPDQLEMRSIRDAITDMIERNPLNTELVRFRGSLFQRLGDIERALSDFSATLELDINDSLAYIARSECHAKLGSLESAFRDLERGISAAPNDPSVYIARARLLAEKNEDIRKALEDISHAVKMCTIKDDYHPATWEAMMLKCQIERRAGHIAESLKTLKAAEAIDSMHPAIYREMAESLLRLPDNQRQALESVSYSISLDPSSVESRMIKSRIEVSLGDPIAAIQTLSKTLDSCQTNYETKVHIVNLIAHLKYSVADVAGATQEFDKCLSLSKSPPASLFHNCGLCRITQDDLSGAFDMFRLAVQVDPTFSPAWFHLAKLQRIAGDYYGALESLSRCTCTGNEWVYEKAANLFQTGEFDKALSLVDVKNQVLLGDCLYYTGKLAEAADTFKKVSTSSPYATFMLGLCLEGQGNPEGALDALERCTGPYLAPALRTKSQLEFDCGQYNKAISDLNMLGEIVRLDATALQLRGLCYYRLGEYRDAIVDWIAARDDSFETQSFMAECRLRTGNRDEAKQILDHLIARDKENENDEKNRKLVVRNLLNRASILISQNRFVDADIDLSKCMSLISDKTPRDSLQRLFELRGVTNTNLALYLLAGMDLETAAELAA